MSSVTKLYFSEGIHPQLIDSLETVYNRGGGGVDFEDIGKEISDEDMEIFRNALVHQYPIDHIRFYQFRFTENQIRMLFDGLYLNETVQELYFDEPNFGDFGYSQLMPFLTKSTSLRSLTITFGELTDFSANVLIFGLQSSRSLVEFEFTSSRISPTLKSDLMHAGVDIILARQNAPDEFPKEFQMILDGVKLKMTDD